MIDLPTSPAPAAANVMFLDAGGILKGGLGAPDQRFNRIGSRFGIAVAMPPMKHPKVGRQWVARLIRAQSEGARLRWPLQGFNPGSPGSTLVNGAGQAGSTLIVDGATPYYAFREGQFFSIVTGAAHHVYFVATETIANGSGQASLPIAPPLRVQHADNDVCNFGTPMIEGFLDGDARQWEFAVANFTALSFEIRERK